MKLAAFILAATLAAPVAAADWTPEQRFAYAAMLTAHTIDFGQTMRIAKEPQNWREANVLLGRHPSEARVRNYFIGTGIALGVLPFVCDVCRRAMPATASVLVFNVARNHYLGLRVSF